MSAWADRAGCAGWPLTRGDDPWHPGSSRYDHLTGFDPYYAARPVCAACPVTAECLAEGLALPRDLIAFGGMRAGLTPTELLALVDVCHGCGRQLWRSSRPRPDTHVRHYARGYCRTCWDRDHPTGRPPARPPAAATPAACRECGRGMVSRGADDVPGLLRHRARGLCRTCYSRADTRGAHAPLAAAVTP